ncbi:hypothetical protein HDV05_004240 [Chytridiales sp. JEL 0842]|nr:hypothetical protein HDV05_004240 [Chytridiales sp. JEL 0842]
MSLSISTIDWKMSADLVWLLTRNNSSFLVKRSGVEFSREKGNLYNKNSLKYSAVNTKTVDVSAAGSKGVTVTIKKKTVGPNKVAKSVATVALTRGGSRAINKSVAKIAAAYRPDLKAAAIARASRLLQAQQPAKTVKPKKVRGKKAAQ